MSLRQFWTAALACVMVVATGCTNYNRDLRGVVASYQSGRVDAAAAELEGLSGRPQDRLLILLERGKALQDAGRFRDSIAVFDQADAIAEKASFEADLRIGQEIGSLAIEQTVRDYNGSPADHILLSTYQALNHLALGDIEEARVHLRRAYDRQQAAVDVASDRIAAAKREESRSGINVSQSLRGTELDPNAGSLAGYITPAYADYANPMTTWLSAVLAAVDGDASNAEVDFRKALGMMPRNGYVEDELKGRGFQAMRDAGESVVYVIYEGGMAPRLDPIQIPVATSAAGLSVLSLPALRVQPPQTSGLTLAGSGVNEQTQPIASVSSIMATDYNDQLPLILIRTALSIAAKEVATQQLRKEGGDWGLVIGSVYKLATSSVDLRTWRTAGAEFEIARFARPPDGRLTIGLTGGGGVTFQQVQVDLPDAPVVFILTRSVAPNHLRTTVTPIGGTP